jgi:ribosomal protein S3
MLFNVLKRKVNVVFYPLSKESITTDLLVYYMKWKIRRKFTFRNSLKVFIKKFYSKRGASFISGFYAKGFGRFTRRQRASMIKRSEGKVSFSSYDSLLSYSYLPVITKYGVGSVRLWINYSSTKLSYRHNSLDLLK